MYPAYIAPHTLQELLAVLNQKRGLAKIISGGTDLIPQMRIGKLSPLILVDPIHLPQSGITESDGFISLDARITHAQVISSRIIQRGFPALVAACQQVGAPPIRNRGTLAGNLANASPAADSALPLLVYDARVVASSLSGERILPLVEFYTGPGQTRLVEDEFIREIQIPNMTSGTRAIFIKLGLRQAMAIAIASVAVRLSFDKSGKITEARIALGSVAPTPLRAFQAEAILQSAPLSTDTIQFAAQVARQAAAPISDVRASAGYRSQMVAVLVKRALGMIYQDLII